MRERDALQVKVDRIPDIDYVLNVDSTWKAKNKEISDLRAVASKQGWINVTEELPPIGKYVIVVIDGIVQRQAANFSGEVWEWADESADSAPKEAVTHWQPLPTMTSVVSNIESKE
jgi:hypothetical protein